MGKKKSPALSCFKDLVYFEICGKSQLISGICNIGCVGEAAKVKSKGATSGFVDHLRNHHSAKFTELYPQITQPSVTQQSVIIDPNEINKSIVRFIVKSKNPLSTITSDEFKSIFTSLKTDYELFGRKDLDSFLAIYFEQVLLKLKLILSDKQIALSIDIWTSGADDSFLGVCAHFIDDSFKFNTRFIGMSPLYTAHTADLVKFVLLSILDDLSITKSVKSVTTDYAANMIASCKRIEEEYVRLPCSAHSLQLILKPYLKYFKDLIDLARKLIRYFSKSDARRRAFHSHEFQTRGSAAKYRPGSIDIELRWGSTFKMLQELVSHEDTLISFNYEKFEGVRLTEDQFEQINEVVNFLQPFDDATEMLSTAKSPTLASLVLLRLKLERDWIPNSPDEVKPLMMEKCDKYFHLTKLHWLVLLLDPYCYVSFRNYCKNCDPPINNDTNLRSCRNNLRGLFTHLQAENHPDPIQPKKKQKAMDRLFGEPLVVVSSEIDMYFNELHSLFVYGMEISTNKFWRTKRYQYPTLYNIARDHLMIPASEVSAERVFSVCGQIVDDQREHLSEIRVKTLSMLHQNFDLI